MPVTVTVPLVNPNEPEAFLATLYVKEGQSVSTGELLCTLETTKATSEITAETDGFVVGLRLAAGQTVQAGEVLCYLADSPDWKPPVMVTLPKEDENSSETILPPALRITRPALELARKLGLNLSSFPSRELVTVAIVRSIKSETSFPVTSIPDKDFDPTAILVYGGGGHGKTLIELIRSLDDYHIVGVVDDNRQTGENILGVPVLGGSGVLREHYSQGVHLAVNAVGGIGNIASRINVFQTLADAGFIFPVLVHPSSFVEPSASLSSGVQVFPHAYIGSDVRVGFGAIVNTGAIVSHDCVLGEYANISPGAMLAGDVHVGSAVLVGMGVTINLGVKIGEAARIGNSAVVKSDVPQRGIVRAGAVWPG